MRRSKHPEFCFKFNWLPGRLRGEKNATETTRIGCCPNEEKAAEKHACVIAFRSRAEVISEGNRPKHCSSEQSQSLRYAIDFAGAPKIERAFPEKHNFVMPFSIIEHDPTSRNH